MHQIICGKRYEQDLRSQFGDDREALELETFFEWILRRGPRILPAIPLDKDHYMLVNDPVGRYPAFRLVYHVDDTSEEVTLLAIDFGIQ